MFIGEREALVGRPGLGADTHTARALSGPAARLVAVLASAESFDELLTGIADLATQLVPGAVTASLTLVEHDRVIAAAATDDAARLLDEGQCEHSVGPGLAALRARQVVHVQDLAGDERWPTFAATALRHGLRSALAVPLAAGEHQIGVLNLYSRASHAFADGDRALVRTLAAEITLTVSGVLRRFDETTLADHLRRALSSRSIIDQAIGIVMARHGLPAEDALRALRGASQRRNVKLRVVAAELVRTTLDAQLHDRAD